MSDPYISIVTPIYNRNKFKHLIITNLLKLDYDKTKLEYIIDDDGDEKFINSKDEFNEFQEILKPIKFVYKWYPKRRSIGEKRNNLCKISSYKLIANMDSDDLMLSDWLNHSLEVMRSKHYKLVGTNQMIFCFPKDNFRCTGIQCGTKRMIHEAGMLFKKQHWRATGGFLKNSAGEGTSMVDNMNPNTVGLTRADKVIICICHDNNTVCKDRFKESQELPELDISEYDKQLVLRCI